MGDHGWLERLAREWPLVERVLSEAPSPKVIDLGCGTGEWARFLGGQGFEVVGLDSSEEALDAAQVEPLPESVHFVLTDMGAVERSVRGHFGSVLCLGNTLPYLLSPESVSRMLIGVKRRLAPGGRLLIQLLNYERVRAGTLDALPVEKSPSDDGETVVVRLLRPRSEGIVVHTTSTLRHRLTGEPAMEVIETRRTQLRGWKLRELETLLDSARLTPREVLGDMTGARYDPQHSPELVVVAA